MGKWEYVETYVDEDMIHCPTCDSHVLTQLTPNSISEFPCAVCGTELQVKYTEHQVTELYKKEEDKHGSQETTQENGDTQAR